MGTSINQRSIDGGAWAAQHAVIGRAAVPIARQITEIWRAAAGDRDQSLMHELCSPEIVAAARIAASAPSPLSASEAFENVLYESDSGSMVVEFARRSLVRATSSDGGAAAYGADLFAEAASYLVARDLPSYVGAAGRVSTSLASIELKATVREQSRSTAQRVASTLNASAMTTDKGWGQFIKATLKALAEGGKNV